MPPNFTNPALNSPVWGPDASPPKSVAKPESQPRSPISPAGGAAFGLSCVFLVGAVAGIAYFLWNRNAWKMKRDQARAGDIPAVEMENGGGVLKLSGVRDTDSHEPDIGVNVSMAGTGVHSRSV